MLKPSTTGIRIVSLPSPGQPHPTTQPSAAPPILTWTSPGPTSTKPPLPKDGTWILPEAVFENPVGLIGIRVGVGPVLVALQCAMGVDSQGPLGVNSQDPLSSPTPDSELIAFPIQPR